jgi:hypothetical protein
MKFSTSTNYRYEGMYQKHLLGCAILMLIAIAIPMIAYSSLLKPDDKSLKIWFQRSDSLMTVVCLVLDITVLKLKNILCPTSSFGPVGLFEFRQKYLLSYKVFGVVAPFLTLAGTLIWGYGDLLVWRS